MSRRAVKYPWNGNTVSLTVNFSSHGTKKVSPFFIQVPLTYTYGDLLSHLKASNAVTGNVIGKKESSKEMTLAEAGILPGTVVEIKGYKPAKTCSQSLRTSVKIPNGPVIHLPVIISSTIGDLKHKIQDEIGMPVEEQLLKYNGGNLKNRDNLPCGHNKQPLILKWQPIAKKEVRGTESKSQTKSQKHQGIAKPTEKQLMEELHTTVASEWRTLGTFLEIASEELNIIDERHRGDPQKCLMAMLNMWLHRTNPPPGWHEIVAAVEFIGKFDVAQMIREKYYHSEDDPKCSVSQLPSNSIPQHADFGGTSTDHNGDNAKQLPGTSTSHYEGISTGEDTTDGPYMNRKHIMYTDQGCNRQAHAQIPDSTSSLVERVPAIQPSEPQLEQIADKIVEWEGLATHLGINEQKQVAIKEDHKNKYERQKVDMLHKWRRQNGSQATWKVLVKTSLTVGDRQLAEDIIRIYLASSQVHLSTVKPPQPVHPETATVSPSPERSRASFPEIGSPSVSARRGSCQDNEEYIAALKSQQLH